MVSDLLEGKKVGTETVIWMFRYTLLTNCKEKSHWYTSNEKEMNLPSGMLKLTHKGVGFLLSLWLQTALA